VKDAINEADNQLKTAGAITDIDRVQMILMRGVSNQFEEALRAELF